MSVFENDEFTRGFIEFYGSQDFEKYMRPFLAEVVEAHRDKLETTDDPKSWQGRLKAVRFIMDQAEIQKINRQERVNATISER